MCKCVAYSDARRPQRSWAGEKALLAQIAVAEAMGLSLGDMFAKGRGDPQVAFARQTAMYLCRLVFAMRNCQIAETFGRDRSTVAHALHRIEEARENPDIDRQLTWLENLLLRAGGGHG